MGGGLLDDDFLGAVSQVSVCCPCILVGTLRLDVEGKRDSEDEMVTG